MGTQPVTVERLRRIGDRLDGHYCYDRYCAAEGVPRLLLDGHLGADGSARLRETSGGVESGRWTLQRDGDGWHGHWHSVDGRRRLPVLLRSDTPAPDWQLSVFLDSPLPDAGDCPTPPAVVAIGIRRGDRQQVLAAESQGNCSLYLPEVADLDFDGHPDLMLAQFLPAGPNIPYQYWRQDPRSGRFEDITVLLEDVTSPEFDPQHKQIHNFWRAGAASHGVTIWRWVEGRRRWRAATAGSSTCAATAGCTAATWCRATRTAASRKTRA